MIHILEVLKEFRSRPLCYWLGMSEPFEYEVTNGCVFRKSSGGRRQVLVLREIQHWKKNVSEKTISLYQADCTRVIGDHSNKLGAILERELPERWIVKDPP